MYTKGIRRLQAFNLARAQKEIKNSVETVYRDAGSNL